MTKHTKHVSIFKYLLFVSILFMPSCSFFDADLNGEIFIVTAGRQNIKLALVQISAIPEKDMIPFIDKKMSEAKKEIVRIKPEYEKLVAEEKSLKMEKETARDIYFFKHILSTNYKNKYNQARDAYQKKYDERHMLYREYLKFIDGEYYFNGIPKTEKICTSNSDGKFSLRLKRNTKYAIVAKSSRKVVDSEEIYYWLIWVDMNNNPQNVTLSNNNLFSENAPESIIKMKNEIPY